MQPIHIFLGQNRQQDALAIHLRGKRKLHQNAIDIGPVVQLANGGEQFPGSGGFRRPQSLRIDAEVLAGLDLVADVNFGSRVVPYQHYRQSRRAALGGQRRHARLQFGLNFVAYACAIENLWHAF